MTYDPVKGRAQAKRYYERNKEQKKYKDLKRYYIKQIEVNGISPNDALKGCKNKALYDELHEIYSKDLDQKTRFSLNQVE